MKSHGPKGVLVELLFYLEKLMNEQDTMKIKATSESKQHQKCTCEEHKNVHFKSWTSENRFTFKSA